ncbi:MAG: molybdopterin-dependent oxidoreductase, partial [Pseudorhodoplanes sp.]
TAGLPETLARAREVAPDVAATAAACGLRVADVARLFDWFRTTEKVVTCFSQGVNQSAQGTDKVNAIINCHLATGRIGKAGMGPLSLTGQPNAMGGREVGGLANQLAAHMGFAAHEVERVGRFWRASAMARREGLKAVSMFEAIERGRLKALWVMATNPAVSLPRAGAVREALGRLDLLVVSDNVFSTDTIGAGAHVLLPAAAWGEKDGTVTNSERRISRQRSFLPAPGDARPDWQIVADVARRMGYGDAFDYNSAADVFREHAALSAFENGGARDFDIGGLASLTDAQFDALDPVQWPLPKERGASSGKAPHNIRFFSDGAFFTADRKARLVVPERPALNARASQQYPLRLNTGRIRDQWHTMTRSGLSPRLATHSPEPFVEVHPDDARTAGLVHGGFARVRTAHGSCVLKVAESDSQRRGSLFVPIHWSAETASCARVGDLVAPAQDPYSGQPEAKATPAAIEPVEYASRGFVLAHRDLPLPAGTWWSRIAVKHGIGVLFASNASADCWRAHAQAVIPAGDIAEYVDGPRGIYRAAAFDGGRLVSCLFMGPAATTPQWDAVKALFEAETLGDAQRRAVLSGRAADGLPDLGLVVCACFGVGLNVIRAALEQRTATSVEEIGAVLRAGTNCGSCLPELKRIVAHDRVTPTA